MPRKEGKGAYHAIRDYIHKGTGRAAGPSESAVQDNREKDISGPYQAAGELGREVKMSGANSARKLSDS